MSAHLAAVHASAPEPLAVDLFGEVPATRADCRVEFTGRLAHKPHVAVKPLDAEGATVPVLVIELQDVGAGHHPLIAHIPYTHATRAEAEAAAKRLQRDQVVTVTTQLTDIRLLLAGASLSHDINP